MKLTVNSFVALTFALLATGCGKNKTGNDEDHINSIVYEDATRTSIDSLIQQVDIIPLELDSAYYPYGIRQVLLANDKIIILDNKNVIFTFTNDGQYISDSNKKIGKGDGEYSILTAMTYNKFSDCIEVATPTHLLCYDENFNFIGSSELPTKIPKKDLEGMLVGNIYDISATTHLLIPESVLVDSRRILIYDSNKKKVLKEISFDQNIMSDITMQTENFYDLATDEYAFFPPAITNYTYRFNPSNSSLTKDYYLDYGSNGIKLPEAKREKSYKENLRSEIIESNALIPLKTMLSGDYLIVVLKEGNNIRDFHTLFWNRKTEKGYVIDSFKDDKPYFPILDSAFDSSLYSIVDYSNVSQLTSVIEPTKINMPKDSIPDGSYVVLRYKLK